MSVVTIGKAIFTSRLLDFSNKGEHAIRCSEANVSSLRVHFRKHNNLNIKKMQTAVALLVLMEEGINWKRTHCDILTLKNPQA